MECLETLDSGQKARLSCLAVEGESNMVGCGIHCGTEEETLNRPSCCLCRFNPNSD